MHVFKSEWKKDTMNFWYHCFFLNHSCLQDVFQCGNASVCCDARSITVIWRWWSKELCFTAVPPDYSTVLLLLAKCQKTIQMIQSWHVLNKWWLRSLLSEFQLIWPLNKSRYCKIPQQEKVLHLEFNLKANVQMYSVKFTLYMKKCTVTLSFYMSTNFIGSRRQLPSTISDIC